MSPPFCLCNNSFSVYGIVLLWPVFVHDRGCESYAESHIDRKRPGRLHLYRQAHY